MSRGYLVFYKQIFSTWKKLFTSEKMSFETHPQIYVWTVPHNCNSSSFNNGHARMDMIGLWLVTWNLLRFWTRLRLWLSRGGPLIGTFRAQWYMLEAPLHAFIPSITVNTFVATWTTREGCFGVLIFDFHFRILGVGLHEYVKPGRVPDLVDFSTASNDSAENAYTRCSGMYQ